MGRWWRTGPALCSPAPKLSEPHPFGFSLISCYTGTRVSVRGHWWSDSTSSPLLPGGPRGKWTHLAYYAVPHLCWLKSNLFLKFQFTEPLSLLELEWPPTCFPLSGPGPTQCHVTSYCVCHAILSLLGCCVASGQSSRLIQCLLGVRYLDTSLQWVHRLWICLVLILMVKRASTTKLQESRCSLWFPEIISRMRKWPVCMNVRTAPCCMNLWTPGVVQRTTTAEAFLSKVWGWTSGMDYFMSRRSEALRIM